MIPKIIENPTVPSDAIQAKGSSMSKFEKFCRYRYFSVNLAVVYRFYFYYYL